MSAIDEAVGRLVPTSEGRPLLQGLLVGVLLGAALAGVFVIGQTVATRRAQAARPGPPPAPLGPADPSPL